IRRCDRTSVHGFSRAFPREEQDGSRDCKERRIHSMSLPVLRLSGTPYEMGVTHGKVLQDRIAHNVNLYYDRFQREIHLDKTAVHEVAARFTELAKKASPDYFAGLQGVAEGSGFDLLDIAAINARYEILYYQFGRMAVEKGLVEWLFPEHE